MNKKKPRLSLELEFLFLTCCATITSCNVDGILANPELDFFRHNSILLPDALRSATILSYITNPTHITRLKQQYETIPSLPNDPQKKLQLQKSNTLGGIIKNSAAVRQTTQHGIVFTQKTVEALQTDFGPTALQADLFDLDNLRLALLNILNMALNPEAGTEFPKDIRKSGTHIYNALNDLKENLSNDWDNLKIYSKSDEEPTIEEQKLWCTYKALKSIHQIILTETTIANTLFAKFIYGMMTACKVAFLRTVAAKIMEKHRAEIESAAQKATKSTNFSYGIGAAYGAAKANFTISAQNTEGMTDTSFYQVEFGTDIKLNVGAGIGKLFAQIGVDFSLAAATIFYSLEQLIDSGEFNGKHLKLSAVKKVLESRKKMQKREKELLSIFSGQIEGFLKITGVLSPFVTLLFPAITKTLGRETRFSKGIGVEGEISIASIGLTLKRSSKKRVHAKRFGLLTLLDDDCSPADSYRPSDLVTILGSDYNLAQQHLNKIASYTDINNNYDETALAIVLNNILEDIRRYNDVLSALADPSSDKKRKQQLEKEKHLVESRWLVNKNHFKSEGRDGVLRALVVTIPHIREICNTAYAIAIFNQIYNELCKLAALCEFSKNKKKRSAEFKLEAEAHDIIWSGGLTFPGGISIDFSKTKAMGHPFMEDNGEFIDIEITLPMTLLGLIGMKVVQSKMISIFGALSKRGGEISEGLGNAGTVVQDVLLLLARNSAIPFISNVMSMIPIGTSKITIRLRRLDAFSCTHPLPGAPTIIDRNRNRWEVLYIQTMALSNIGLGIGTSDIPGISNSLQNGIAAVQGKLGNLPSIVGQVGNVVSELAEAANQMPINYRLSFSRSLGKRERIIGSDALFYLTARYNVMKLGNSNTVWSNLTSEQAPQIWLLFANIPNVMSNARYELQIMYNKVLNNAPSSEKGICTQKFSNFIESCNNFADLPAAGKAFIDFLPLYNGFIKKLRACQEVVTKVHQIKFEKDPSLQENKLSKLDKFVGELQKCHTSSKFRELHKKYHHLLRWFHRKMKGSNRGLFRELSNKMNRCEKYAERILKKRYYEICELITDKAHDCHTMSQFKDLLREFRSSIRLCSESPLALTHGSNEESSELHSLSTKSVLTKQEKPNIDSDELQTNEEGRIEEGKKDQKNIVKENIKTDKDDKEELPSNYEKLIIDLNPELLEALDSTNSSHYQPVRNLMLAIAKSKRGLPADYESNTKKMEDEISHAMSYVPAQLLAVISSLNIKVQKLLAETILFNSGVLTLFALLRSQINEEYAKTLQPLNEVLEINHKYNFLLERNRNFSAPQY